MLRSSSTLAVLNTPVLVLDWWGEKDEKICVLLLESLGVNSNPYQPLYRELRWEKESESEAIRFCAGRKEWDGDSRWLWMEEREGRWGEKESIMTEGRENEVTFLWDDHESLLLTHFFKWPTVAINCSTKFPYTCSPWCLSGQVSFSHGHPALLGSPEAFLP